MFAAARIEKIRELISDQKRIEVIALTKILNVSEATVRRDLEKLEAEGFLFRTHGGAILKASEDSSQETSTDEISQEKQMIASFAQKYVSSNEIIYIGAGSTCYQFALELKDKKDITIVTSNLDVSTGLAGYTNINVLLTGGAVQYRAAAITLVGQFANDMLDKIYVDKAFVSADAVDLQYGFSSANSDVAEITRRAMKMSGQTIMLCDIAKFDRKALVKICNLNDVSIIVTNPGIRPEYKSYFYENDIPVLCKYDI